MYLFTCTVWFVPFLLLDRRESSLNATTTIVAIDLKNDSIHGRYLLVTFSAWLFLLHVLQ